jgi:hypothetical protein
LEIKCSLSNFVERRKKDSQGIALLALRSLASIQKVSQYHHILPVSQSVSSASASLISTGDLSSETRKNKEMNAFKMRAFLRRCDD